jgi:hypothetical protein
VLHRAPALTAGTIYSITWPLVRQFAAAQRRLALTAAYHSRPVRNEFDAALDEYAAHAPSRKMRQEADAQAERIHAWDGMGTPPLDLSTLNPTASALRYILPLARWCAEGRPGLTAFARFDTVIVDEAQDMGALELAVASALVAPGGQLICYGDPGQALYAESKGNRGGLPAAWQLGGERRTLTGGHRCGDPLATAAARVLNPIWQRPAATFAAPHRTEIVEWWPSAALSGLPKGALVLSYSRRDAQQFIEAWGLKRVALVPSLTHEAALTVCTGHSAKGAQAEQVYLLPWAKTALARLDDRQPGALRLLYTMLTRARGRVHVPATLLARMQ